MRSFGKQEHGDPNPIYREEEFRILSAKEQSVASGNPQIIGRNGEVPVIDFLRRYLPNAFRVETGFFVTPEGELSPQIDILVLDSRYPLLSHNADGSVIAMLHAVVHVIEVKTTVGKREIRAVLQAAERIFGLSSSVFPRTLNGAIGVVALGYGASLRLDSVERHFFGGGRGVRECDLVLLRVSPSEAGADGAVLGAELHWEPDYPDFPKHAIPARWAETPVRAWVETTRFTHAPLSDLYYHLVQSSYYALSARHFDFGEIGQHMMAYMSWGTYRLS
jgi:hypothetical protein